MNISDEFMEHLKNEEGLYFRSAITTSLVSIKRILNEGFENHQGQGS